MANLGFPYLLESITNFDLPAASRQYYIIGLLLSKRVYLYAVAFVTLLLAVTRSSMDEAAVSSGSSGDKKFSSVASLGARLQRVNNDVFSGIRDDLVMDSNSFNFIEVLGEESAAVDSTVTAVATTAEEAKEKEREREKERRRAEQQGANAEMYQALDGVSEVYVLTL